MQDEIFVTRPFLPDLKEFTPYLERIWQNKVLTNNGPMHNDLEKALCDYLDVEHLSLFSNGTLALTSALRELDLNGEIITTPFSFIATSHALLLNGLTPVFVDTEPGGFNLDPDRIEAAITPKTSAILAVHCYGFPCDFEKIRKIADKHNLKVVYDSAHAFGVKSDAGNLLTAGDSSILSFHATKVFHTFEGGAVICSTAEQKKRLDRFKNFGIIDEVTVGSVGLNAKLNEVSAAFGLLHLAHMDTVLEKYREISEVYISLLQDTPGISLPRLDPKVKGNNSYFPILITEDHAISRDEIYRRLKTEGIYSRRYFYPLISHHPMYKDLPSANCDLLPNAYRASQQVLCLPIYPDLARKDIDRICNAIKANS